MLTLNEDEFPSGVSTYFEEYPFLKSAQTYIHISIVLEGQVQIPAFARLDPATPWVVLNSELNEQIGLRATPAEIELHTLAGLMKGRLERFPIRLMAEQGDSLEIESTLFVCDDWRRGNFLGYSGFIERIQFAVDPVPKKFYFGSPSAPTRMRA